MSIYKFISYLKSNICYSTRPFDRNPYDIMYYMYSHYKWGMHELGTVFKMLSAIEDIGERASAVYYIIYIYIYIYMCVYVCIYILYINYII